MAADRNIDIVYRARVQEYQRGIEQMRQSTDGLAQHTDQATTKIDSSYRRTSDRIRSYFTVAVAVMAGKQMIDAAAELEQAVGGTSAVFAEASGVIDEFASRSAESAGLSQRAARELTSQIGAMLQGFGFARQEAADWSVTLAQLGADLAATFGGKPEQAVQALGAALRGEFDPLERFGISLNVSKANLKAVEMGLAESTSQVDMNARAQATLALIMEQSASAQGQFAREADTAAGQAAIASAKTEDAAASMGRSLLPVYAKAAEVVGTLADGFANLPAPMQTALIAGAGFVAFAGPLGAAKDALVGLIQTARQMPTALRAARSMFQSMSTEAKVGALAGGAALAGLTAAIMVNQRSAAQNAETHRRMAQAILDGGENADRARQILDELSQGSKLSRDLAADVTKELERQRDAMSSSERATHDLSAAQREYADLIASGTATEEELAAAREKVTEASAAQERVQSEVTAATEEGAAATEKSTAATEKHTKAAKDAYDALDELKSVIDELIGTHVSSADAMIDVEQGYADLTAKILENGATLDIHTEAGRDNLSAINDQVDAVLDLAQAMADETGDVTAASRVLSTHRDRLIDTMVQTGLTREAAERYVDSLGLIPENIDTVVNLDITDAERKLHELTGLAFSTINAMSGAAQFQALDHASSLRGRSAGAPPGRDPVPPATRSTEGSVGRARGVGTVYMDGKPVGRITSEHQRRDAIGSYAG